MTGIIVERRPHLVVTDRKSGWSMTGGRRDGDGASTKEMTHPNGARCTLRVIDESTSDAELVLRITGMLYLSPDEAKAKAILKEPEEADFISAPELYQVGGKLLRAWYEATFTTSPPLTVKLPVR
jgi:hypothetical protein